MSNIELRPLVDASSFRRIAASAWPGPSDPTIHGLLEVRAERLLRWLHEEGARTGEKLTVTHAVARAVALVLARHPDLNGLVRWGTIHLRQSVDVFLQVAVPAEDGRLGKTDLSGVLLRGADDLPIATMARQLRERAQAIREGRDAEFQRTKGTLSALPAILLRPLLLLLDLLQIGFNLDLRWAGLPRDPFGSAMVTSLGMMGVRVGFAPIFPLAHAPILVLVGAVEDRPVVEQGAVAVGKVLTLSGSFDHRMVDGYHAARFAKDLQALLEAPEGLATPT